MRTPVLSRFLCLAALAFTLAMAAAAPAPAQHRLDGESLVQALREGGHTIYFRHAPTDWKLRDHVAAVGDWVSCDPDTMRQLSDEGRALARRVGEALRALGVPVGRVRSSEYCRAAETARLLDVGTVETTRELMNTRVAHLMGGEAAVARRGRALLSEPPAPGTNTVLVAHGNLLRAATGEYVPELGAVVFDPQGPDGPRPVAQLAPADWERLAAEFADAN